MPVQEPTPEELQGKNVISVDSTATNNVEAILEIDEWAAKNGFVRGGEYWLRQVVQTNGQHVFRAICYRLTDEDRREAEEASKRVKALMKQMPVTRHTRE